MLCLANQSTAYNVINLRCEAMELFCLCFSIFALALSLKKAASTSRFATSGLLSPLVALQQMSEKVLLPCCLCLASLARRLEGKQKYCYLKK